MTVRVRFSPAPTGYLHVGGARSALFNWLYARNQDGTMILRIEDTDVDRSSPELISAIHDSLSWLGIDWDEEYRQSDRFDTYLQIANGFLESGHAYRCDCTQEVAQARVKERGGPPGYDGHCRDRDVQPGKGVVVRFRTPDEGVTAWDDVIRGRVEFDNAVLEDFVVVRSNGTPMFHVANAYDDMDMKISHVIRGEDLVNTTPRVILLREAMGGTEHPVYAHLPLIVNAQRKKLSKRRDDVAVGDYKDKGILPEAMRNYLATLGWGPKIGEEIAPIEDFIKQFDIADIVKSPAFFDIKKLENFNSEYIRQMDVDKFVELTLPDVGEVDEDLYKRLAPDIQGRIKVLSESASLIDWVVGDAPEPIEKDWKKVMGKDGVAAVLDLVIERIATVEWNADSLEKLVFGVGEELSTKTQLPVRMAVSGSRFGLPLFPPMAEMDREVIIQRLKDARAKI